MIDVVILAGGKATRLHGLWKGPKCLVPVGGMPLLGRLLGLCLSIKAKTVRLALGHGGEEVERFFLKWWESTPTAHSHYGAQLGLTHGTHAAVRECVRSGPVLVLNGDTLPLFDLRSLLAYHEQRHGAWATTAMVPDLARWRERYAGACVLSQEAIEEIRADQRTYDFPAALLGAQRYFVPGFLDVGTPEGFKQAQEYKD